MVVVVIMRQNSYVFIKYTLGTIFLQLLQHYSYTPAHAPTLLNQRERSNVHFNTVLPERNDALIRRAWNVSLDIAHDTRPTSYLYK